MRSSKDILKLFILNFGLIALLAITIASCCYYPTKPPATYVGPKSPGRLVLFVPAAEPSAIQTSKESTTEVKFMAIVGGTSTPSNIWCRDGLSVEADALCLDEVDAKGKPLKNKAVAKLRRDIGTGVVKHSGDLFYGTGANEKAHNLVYTGTLSIPSTMDAEKYYRVRAEYFCETLTSDVATFGITSFDLDPRPSNRKSLTKVPESSFQLFSDEVVMRLRPALLSDPDRVKDIAAKVKGTVVGVIPALRTYLVEIPGDGKAAGVWDAIAVLKDVPGVEQAFPNFEVIAEAVPSETPVGCVSDTANCQWYIEHVGIDKAWKAVDGLTTSSLPVAIFDNSGIDATHSDLNNGQCVSGGGISPCAHHGCRPHGTWVAGVVGATANDGGIAGVAWDIEFWSYRFDPSVGSSYNFSDAIQGATQDILNISHTSNDVLRDAVENAICEGRLIIAAAGNVGKNGGACAFNSIKYPAAYNNLSDTLSCLTETDKRLSSRILAVGATDIQNGLAEWTHTDPCNDTATQQCSNLQDWIDVFAPGKNIYTTNVSTATLPGLYEHISGTSLATATVSGAAAIVWGSKPPGWTAKQIHDALINKATTLTSSETSDSRIWGERLINVFAALGNSYTLAYDFETPPLGSGERDFINPYDQPEVSFSIANDLGFSDAAVGLVRNRATSACAEPRDGNQKLGTGRDPGFPGSVGLSGFPIRAQFDPVLHPLGTPVTVSVEVQTGAGVTVRLRLFSPSGIQVAEATGVASPASGTCGFPGPNRARSVITATVIAPVVSAIVDLPGNTPSGGYVFVIDNVNVVAGSH